MQNIESLMTHCWLAAGLGSAKAAPTSSSDPSSPSISSPGGGGSSQAGGGEQSMSQDSGSPTPRSMAYSGHSSPLFRGVPGSGVCGEVRLILGSRIDASP